MNVSPKLIPAIREYFAGQNGRFDLIKEFVLVPGGESAKNDWNAVHGIYRAIEQHGLFRHCYVIGSRKFAVADHQVAHIYLNDPALTPEVRTLLEKQPVGKGVLDANGQAQLGINHARSGDLIAIDSAA